MNRLFFYLLITAAFLAPASIPLKASQPLPQGKANFTVTLGRMDTTNPWVRVGQWTFNGSAGTVGATFWSWSWNNKLPLANLNNHRCTFDGVTSWCNVMTPYGWVYPSGNYWSWSGTYTYNPSTGRLNISWTSGAPGNFESWDVSLPDPDLARVKFVLGSSTYHVTHGRGYGSNASWSTFKTMANVPKANYTDTTGRRVMADQYNGLRSVDPVTPGAWRKAALMLGNFHYPSAPSPVNTIHAWLPSTACGGACQTTRSGIVYHLASNNNGRQMAYNNWCACLPSNSSWPCYSGNMHPSAMMQIIDDTGAMRGMIGMEAQNPPSGSSGYPNYQFHLWDFTAIPGS